MTPNASLFGKQFLARLGIAWLQINLLLLRTDPSDIGDQVNHFIPAKFNPGKSPFSHLLFHLGRVVPHHLSPYNRVGIHSPSTEVSRHPFFHRMTLNATLRLQQLSSFLRISWF